MYFVLRPFRNLGLEQINLCTADADAQHYVVNFKHCGRDVFRRKQLVVIGDLGEEVTVVIVMELAFVGLE